MQFITMSYFGFGYSIAIIDSLVLNVLLAGACFGIVYIMQFYLPQKEKSGYVIAVSLVSSALVVLASQFILRYIFSTNTEYLTFLAMAWPIKASIVFLLSACMALVSLVYYTMEEQKEMELRKYDAEQLSREAELFNLRQQLQPHFLFNSLNSISALAGSQPEEARKMIQQLSDFLRGTVRKDNQQLITFDEELKHLQLYLEIEKVRFGHRLTTVIDCDEICRGMKIPSLLLQPVVENAIKFGLYDTLDTVTISIQAHRDENSLVVSVTNPFDSTSAPQKGTGFGLNSIQRRLYLLFARNDLIFTKAENGLFTTTIKIPQVK